MRKWKYHYLPVISGFLVLYLLVMTVATFLVYSKYMEEFEMRYEQKVKEMQVAFQNTDFSEDAAVFYDLWTYRPYRINSLLGYLWNLDVQEYQQFSAAFYDAPEDEMITCTKDYFYIDSSNTGMDREDYYAMIGVKSQLSDYMTDEEIQKIAAYLSENLKFNYKFDGQASEYKLSARINKHANAFYGFSIIKVTWERSDTKEPAADPYYGGTTVRTETDDNGQERRYVPVSYETVWEWTDPKAEAPERAFYIEYRGITVIFPYLRQGYDSWKKWRGSHYLQNHVRDMDAEQLYALLDSYHESGVPAFTPQYSRAVIIDYDDGNTGILYLASECHPWMAAIDYMKYVYPACLMLMLLCLFIVLHLHDRTEHQRAAIEENRNNFTRILSREMQIPLNIIRKTTEKLKNQPSSENKADYLNQIVKETEKMDHLVADMIDMSKLDSEHLVLQQDVLSVNDIIREQLSKLKPLITERELEIRIQENAPFHITGDIKYLSKAIFNLLNHTVSGSDTGGTLDIVINKKSCSIERSCSSNTGTDEETDLTRTGLYLTKKILDMFHMTIDIHNTDIGVKVMIRL